VTPGGVLKFTILGCGSSGGVPRIGGGAAIPFDGRSSGDWGACDPTEPRNRRTRCSLLVERGETRVLVDTSPDLRTQLLSAGVGTLDGVLFTHDHADQTHGIDDLRMVAINNRARVETYMDEATRTAITQRFGYCFTAPPQSAYPAILNPRPLSAFVLVRIDGGGGPIDVLPFDQEHGDIRSLGFRFGPLAYSSDVSGLTEASFAALEGVECWIVDALRYRPHPTHAHVARALEWIARVRPKRAILTNLHTDLDYRVLKAELPAGVEPAYDGLTIEYPA
jgi:phosphoribosyl 1,2-cyclic phosphate phosphodiesterase